MQKVLLSAAVFHICICALIGERNQAYGGTLDDMRAARYAYFAQYKMLPLFPPRGEVPGEVPGEVYYEPEGVFWYRWDKCFGDQTPFEVMTVLPKVLEAKRSTSSVASTVSAREIARASAQYNLQFHDTIQISFSHPRGQPIVRGFSANQLEESLRKQPTLPCHADIIRILQRDPAAMARSEIPWILQEIVYATEQITYNTNQDLSSSAQADIQKNIKSIEANADVKFSKAGQGTATIITYDTEFPVAWRPAYISYEHYVKLKEAEGRGYFGRFLEWLGAVESKQEILLKIREEFPKEVVRPREISRDMSSGRAIKFDPKNIEHTNYLRNVGLLYAMSWELYRER